MGFRGLFLHFLLRERKQRKTGGSKFASNRWRDRQLHYLPRSRLRGMNIPNHFFYGCTRKYRYTSIPVVVPIIMVSMVSVPPLPPIFVRISIVAVSVITIV